MCKDTKDMILILGEGDRPTHKEILVKVFSECSTALTEIRIIKTKQSHRALCPCLHIASFKHEEGWENSRQLRKSSTTSRVCILTFENSPNPPSV